MTSYSPSYREAMNDPTSKRLPATRHKLTGQVTMLPEPERAAYVAMLDGFTAQYRPANASETALVAQIANTSWRLTRLPHPQATPAQLARESLSRLRDFDTFERSGKMLRALQTARKAKESASLAASEAGFVFSNPKIANIADHRAKGRRHSRAGWTPPQTAA